MKKYFVGIGAVVTLLVAFTAMPNVSITAQAQTVACPAGYTCTPVASQPTGCPAGFTCTPVTVQPISSCTLFNRNLGIGMSGDDVTRLTSDLSREGLLNGKSDTYDEIVAAAVTSFQEKYASEILTPNGLSNGTGYVGSATRAKLNSLYGCGSPVPYPTPAPINTNAFNLQSSVVGYDSTGTMHVTYTVTASPSLFAGSYTSRWFSWNLQISCPPGITVSMKGGGGCGETQRISGSNTWDIWYANSTNQTQTIGATAQLLSEKDGSVMATDKDALSVPPQSNTSSGPVVFSYPTAGSNLQVGQTYNITWTGSDPGVSSYAVYIVGGSLGNTGSIFLGTAYPRGAGDVGTFSWTLSPTSYAPSGFAPGTGYQIQFSGKGATGGNSQSFNIVSSNSSAPTCTLSTDKSYYSYGDPITLTWTSQNATYASWYQDTSGKDHISLPGDKLTPSGINTVTATVIGNPTFTLQVGGYSGTGSCSKTVNISMGTSPYISVTYPQAGYSLYNGLGKGDGTPSSNPIATITWTSSNLAALPIEIDLLNTTGYITKNIATNLPNTGSYRWLYDPTIPSGNYTLLVSSQAKEGTPGSGAGRSGVFSITTDTSSGTNQSYITITSPTAGVNYRNADGTLPIRWTDTRGKGVAQSYIIGLANNYGKSNIATVSTYQAGCAYGGTCTFSWNPQTFTSPTNNVISIYDVANDPNGNAPAYSGNFSLANSTTQAPSISLVNPTSATFGQTVTLTGSGFSGHDTIIYLVNGSDKAILGGGMPTNDSSMSFNVAAQLCRQYTGGSGLPCSSYMTVTPGTYQIYIVSNSGQSNTVNFTVLGANTSLSVTPDKSTISNGQQVTLNFGIPSNAVTTKLYLSCPSGVSAVWSRNIDVQLCNSWFTLDSTVGSSITFPINNTTGQVQNIVPNFYIYTAANPNYAAGASSQVTVQP